MVKNAGVTDIWIAGFLYGHWYFSLPRIQKACQMVGAMGMNPQVINLPLGHPGDSLGAQSEEVPLGPPANWRMGVKVDGSQRSGTSIHPPPADENSRALKDLQVLGVRKVFLDDDF